MSLFSFYGHVFIYFVYLKSQNRSSRPEDFFKKGALINSTKFTKKHLRRCLFCNKAAGWRPATTLNTESGRGAFLRILRSL